MALPRINIYGYMFHGLFGPANIRRFERRPGVYIVTCACGKDSYHLEIGETADVQSFFLTHPSLANWCNGCKCSSSSRGPVYFAAFYCPKGGKHDRKELVLKVLTRATAEGQI